MVEKITALVVIAILLTLGLSGCLESTSQNGKSSSPEITSIQTSNVETGAYPPYKKMVYEQAEKIFFHVNMTNIFHNGKSAFCFFINITKDDWIYEEIYVEAEAYTDEGDDDYRYFSGNFTTTTEWEIGNYSIDIKVKDNITGNFDIDSIDFEIIRKNYLPNVSIEASSESGTIPLTVYFTSNATDSDGHIVSYHWDFGDGNTSSEENPSHTFEKIGEYNVTLTVEDNDAGSGTCKIMINAIENQPPTVFASADITSGMDPLTIHFTGSAIDLDGDIVSYEWDFGDGEKSNSRNPTHIYNYDKSGSSSPYPTLIGFNDTYYAKLTVTDDGGATSTSDSIFISVIGIRLTVLDVDDFRPYLNKIEVNVKVEVSFEYEVRGAFWLESEDGFKYKTLTVSGNPDVMPPKSSATWKVVFNNIPSDKEFIKLHWNYYYTDYALKANLP